jgi:hypothetical protein
MEQELSNLIFIKKYKKDKIFEVISLFKGVNSFRYRLLAIFAFINAFGLLIILIIFFSVKIFQMFDSFLLKDNKKNLNYYQYIQHNFCDNIHSLYIK